MAFRTAERLSALPPYVFAEIERKKRQLVSAGRDVVDFSIGDPDLPTPDFIVHRLQNEASNAAHHRYPGTEGCLALREAIARWFERRFSVGLDPHREILVLIGSKEGLGHLPLACVDPGDVVLVPSPGYPVYTAGAVFAGGVVRDLPLAAPHAWLPDLETVPDDVARATRLMFLNYPNNPTGAIAELGFFERAVAFARRHDILLAHDAAYSEIWFDIPPPSILQVPGAKTCALEFHSLSKTFNMTGWRIGFAVGQAEAIAALRDIKANLDSGPFGAVQMAAVEGLQRADGPEASSIRQRYRRRRDVLVDGLRKMGFNVAAPRGGFYVWMPVPDGYDSVGFTNVLLEGAGVLVIPGVGFGRAGEGFVRFALTVSEERITEALARIQKM